MNKRFDQITLIILMFFVATQLTVVTQISADTSSNSGMDTKTEQILDIFAKINAIPRCSENEKELRDWLKNRAKANGLKCKTDSTGNIVTEVPGSPGYEKAKKIVFQGHLDMVCEKQVGSSHNFAKDPIKLVYDGEWVHANQTTLGADNGIGIALGLALAEDKTFSHPAFELLFTVSEESGLKGAKGLKSNFFKARKYISLDCEKEGVFVIGSAGLNAIFIKPGGGLTSTPKKYKTCSILVSGLKGGHSGMDIEKKRGNAIIILAELLHELAQKQDIRLMNIEGGTRISAIPRSARALICFDQAQQETIQRDIKTFELETKNQLTNDDTSFAIQMTSENGKKKSNKSYSQKNSIALFKFIATIPNGVQTMSQDFPGVVETSSNLGVVDMQKGKVSLKILSRSASIEGLKLMKDKLNSAAKAGKARLIVPAKVSPWKPVKESEILMHAIQVYKTRFDTDPLVTVAHGALECGIIANKIKGIEMISMGPTIEDAHSPSERLNVESVTRVWEFLVAFLESSKY